MVESLGTKAFELTVESLIASTVLWIAAALTIQVCRIENATWRSRFYLLPVAVPVPVVLMIHLLVRPRLLGASHTPIEHALSSVVETSLWVPLIALGFVAIGALSGGIRSLQLLATLYGQRREWHHQRQEQSPLWVSLNQMAHALALRLKMPPARLIIVAGGTSGSLGLGPFVSYILVSKDLAKLLDREETEGFLAHELAHIKRWDTLMDALMALTRPFLSVNPLAHRAYRCFMEAREEMVDRLAVEAMGDSLALASCLVKACRVSQNSACIVPVTGAVGSVNSLERRVRRLIVPAHLSSTLPHSYGRAFFGVVVGVMALFLITL